MRIKLGTCRHTESNQNMCRLHQIPQKGPMRVNICLIRVFAVRMKKAWVLSYSLSAQRRLLSDWADAQPVLSHRWAHMPFCWFYHEVAQIYFIECVENISFFTSAYWWYFQYMRWNIFGIYRKKFFFFFLFYTFHDNNGKQTALIITSS